MKIFYAAAMIFLGPGLTLKQGLKSMGCKISPDICTSKILFQDTWPYAVLAFVMGFVLFLRVLYKDSKVFELKEKKVFVAREEEVSPIGIFILSTIYVNLL